MNYVIINRFILDISYFTMRLLVIKTFHFNSPKDEFFSPICRDLLRLLQANYLFNVIVIIIF